MCEESGSHRDATITQWLHSRNSGPSRRVHCVQVPNAQKLSLVKNAERNQRVSGRTMRLLTSFSTVCVKNPARAYPWDVDKCLPKKRARSVLFKKSKGYEAVRALAHNFVHKKCVEGKGRRGRVVRLQPAYFLDSKISLRKIKHLPMGKLISHKFIHRNCGQLHPSPYHCRL